MKLFAIALLLAGACSKQNEKPPEPAAAPAAAAVATVVSRDAGGSLDELAALRDRACACTDATCANDVMQAFDGLLAAHRNDRGSASEGERASALSADLVRCTSAVLRPSGGPDEGPAIAELVVGTGPDGEEDPPAYLKLASGENLLKVGEWAPQRANGDPEDFVAVALVETATQAELVFQPEFDKRTTLAFSIPETDGDGLDYASPMIEERPHHRVMVELTTGSLHMEDRTAEVYLVEWNAKQHVPKTIRHWVGPLPNEPDWVD